MGPSARFERALVPILRPLLRWARLGFQVGGYSTAVLTAILAYGSFVAHRSYPFIESLLHFSLALLVTTTVPLLFDRAAARLRRRAKRSRGRIGPAALAIGLSICTVAALFCLLLLEPLYDAGRAMLVDGLAGRLQGDDPARMPLSVWIVFLCFAWFLVTGTLLSLRHSIGLVVDMREADEDIPAPAVEFPPPAAPGCR